MTIGWEMAYGLSLAMAYGALGVTPVYFWEKKSVVDWFLCSRVLG